jgi:DNA-binding PadR family transcriptional regulator
MCIIYLDIHNVNIPNLARQNHGIETMARDQSVSPQPALLGLLMTGPKHGYQLHQEFSHSLGRVWQIGLSQLYAQLIQLEKAGLVAAQTQPQPNRPPRKVYQLTPEGREVFVDWVHQPTPYLRHIRVEFLARLYFFHRLTLPGFDTLVAEQKKVCQAQVERFQELAGETDDGFRRLVLEFRHGQLQAVIQWLDRCLEILSEQERLALIDKGESPTS